MSIIDNFMEYIFGLPVEKVPTFDDLIKKTQQALLKGELDAAWEAILATEPKTSEESNLKYFYISEIKLRDPKPHRGEDDQRSFSHGK